MRGSQSPEHRSYNSSPHYPAQPQQPQQQQQPPVQQMRRSGRQQYLPIGSGAAGGGRPATAAVGESVAMSPHHPSQYNPVTTTAAAADATAMPSSYPPLDMGPYSHPQHHPLHHNHHHHHHHHPQQQHSAHHVMAPGSSSSHSAPPHPPQPQPAGGGGGYLHSFTEIPIPDVMSMEMVDPSSSSMVGLDLSILSAEEHRDFRMLGNRPPPRSGGSGGGMAGQELIPQERGGGSSSSGGGGGGGEGGDRKRRQRRAQSDEESVDVPPATSRSTIKKQRGRPRLDPTDENAADRRRTQIRLAQRAYRLRKETTISSLRSRVAELEGAIENMQSTFLELHEYALDSSHKQYGNDEGDSHDHDQRDREVYAETIRNLGDRFLTQSRAALGPKIGAAGGGGLGGSGPGDAGVPDSQTEDDTADDHPHHRSHLDHRHDRPRSRDEGGGSSAGGPTSGSSPGGPGALHPWGAYQTSYTRGASHDDTYNSGTPDPKSRRGYNEGIAQDQVSLHPYAAHSSSSAPPPSSLTFYPSPPPTTIAPGLDGFALSYSFHETTFSRRLHRAALEGALRLLTSPNVDQFLVAKTFAYTLCYASRQEIINGVTRLLRAGTHESLSPRDYPGAFHPQFPTRSLDSYDDILQAYQDKARKDVLGASNSRLREEAYNQLVQMGIHNRFLAPVEVEQVLVESGILEATISRSSPSTASSSPASASPSTSDRHRSPGSSHGLDLDLDYLSHGSQTSPDSFVFTDPPSRNGYRPASSRSSSRGGVVRNKTVDLDVLVKELVSRGICLGQFPGFKRSDVDDCIQIASTFSTSNVATPVQMVF